MVTKPVTSLAIIVASAGLAYAPLPGVNQSITIVSGSELQEPLKLLETRFEQQNPSIQINLEFQGSQDIVNKYIDDKNDFEPTVLIPANGQLLDELSQRWQAQYGDEPFYETPQPIAKTMLVAVSWPERAKALFPDGEFQWQRLEDAMAGSNWDKIGGNAAWGSFDFVTTDPTRSNSGQLTMSLWSQSEANSNSLNTGDFSKNNVQTLFGLVKRSVYQPPRSTDILLQEFITRGPNDADIATVYESIALHRWEQSSATQGQPYQILYLDPTIETISTAAIVRRDVSDGEAKAARAFIDFLVEPEQQAVFVQHGFRPMNAQVDINSVPNSPWSQNIPGAMTEPTGRVNTPPNRSVVEEVIRQWQRVN
ncbi:abc transporter substrate-binding protein [Leptolyngbya sp. Heron Island J]|uniref:substrate-binding domain-containing protein n=1 Tax=Leptolyngbya sp. Heron Island J TaxID=1385935 RepID=UPI0003B96562|nr:substrate-binding domain-containing protein [Leptolyngbya sp. Heron Island J]ESA34406.1 abc transporter substrate-binding protein [Leptolyngbya sp. Heron Island J]